MSWKDVILEYPWIDVALEVFKGVMPTVIALITVFVTQWCISMRERKNKKKDKTFEYYEAVLKWLIGMKYSFMEKTRLLERVLNIENPETKREQYKVFITECSNMNTEFVLWIDTYDEIIKAFGCKSGLGKFKSVYKECSDELYAVGRKYVQRLEAENATEEINNIFEIFRTSIDSVIKSLANEIGKIY